MRALQDLAVSIYQLPEWLVVRSLIVESLEGERRVALPLAPNAALPPIDGPFTLRIDVGLDRA